ncbi:MAG: T9SS type A sorting domain-containing protein [Candidatus Electryonea clarkiae]|nr:T9SS type A sorting domain-containing protein [Candidatus Electryonea clarkiae]MDP8287835.1 T9SS type A sorting domain-containing protein [Candidatus Electryonea clarkiae]
MNTSTLKQVFTVILILGLTTGVFARFDLWGPEDGVQIRQGHHLNFLGTGVAADGEGNWCVTWADGHTGSQDIYAQLFNSDGEELWTAGGITVANGSWAEQTPTIVYAGEDEWVIAWYDYRNDDYLQADGELYAQRLSANGTLLWDDGVLVADLQVESQLIDLYPTSDGDIIAVWALFRNRLEIIAQRLNTEGDPVWNDDGVSISDSVNWRYSTSINENDELLVVWSKGNREEQIFAEKLTSEGELAWSEGNGVLVSATDQYYRHHSIASDGDGGAFVAWSDPSESEIKGQYLNSSGENLWEDNGALLAETQYRNATALELHSNSSGQLFVAWGSYEEDGWPEHVYSQLVNSEDGAPVFNFGEEEPDVYGIQVSSDDDNADLTGIISDGSNGVIVYYNVNNEPESHSYSMQRISENGNSVWEEEGNILTQQNRPCPQAHSPLIIDDNVFYVWRDIRPEAGGLYFQKYSLDNLTPTFNEEGRNIVRGVHYNTKRSRILRSGESVYTAWIDERYAGYITMPYVQLSDFESGEPQWETNGIPLLTELPPNNDSIQRYHADSLRIIEDENGGMIAFWQAYSDRSTAVYAQRINDSGNLLWGEASLQITSQLDEFGEAGSPYPVMLDDGNILVFHTVMNNETDWTFDLWVQKVDLDGNLGFEDGNGIELIDSEDDCKIHDVILLEDGSVYVSFSVEGHSNYSAIYGMAVDVDGELVWDEPLLLFESEQAHLYQIESTIVDDQIVVVWERYDLEDYRYSLLSQRISLDGEISFDEGGMEINDQDELCGKISVAASDDDAFWLTWVKSVGRYEYQLFTMLYDLDGNPLLDPDTGIAVGEILTHGFPNKVMSDNEGGIYLFWQQGNEWNNSDFAYTHLTRDGSIASDEYGENGVYLTSAFNQQSELYIAPDGEHGVLTAWTDFRGTMVEEHQDDVYIMRVNDLTVTNGVGKNSSVETPMVWQLDTAYPNPFNPSTTIAFSVPTASKITLTVFDVLGREVTRLVDGKISAGKQSVVWNGRDSRGGQAASGMYFYKLEGENVNLSQKMVLMK